MKEVIYLKRAELKLLDERGEVRHVEGELDLLICKTPVAEDDSYEKD